MAAEGEKRPVDKEAVDLERAIVVPSVQALDRVDLGVSFRRVVEGLYDPGFENTKVIYQAEARLIKAGDAIVFGNVYPGYEADFREAESLVGFQESFKDLVGREGVVPIYLAPTGAAQKILYGLALPTGHNETDEEVIALKDGIFTVVPKNLDFPAASSYIKTFKGKTKDISATMRASEIVFREKRHNKIKSGLTELGIVTNQSGDHLPSLAHVARAYKKALITVGLK